MSVETAPSRRARARMQSARGFRTDIQALRAIAIAVVVLNHLWPTRLTGGYVGVDVFFVISGFLITSHLLGELARTGRIRLGRFYARRIRRLLPAALLVLAVSAVLVAVFLPYPRWLRNAAEIAASAGYVENWALAALAVDYSAVNAAASVAQHYWSLSVEEQFYIVWPLLLLGAVLLARAIRAGVAAARAALTVVVVVAVGSLLASILFTAASPSAAYFTTFTRAWEFAIGGLIALAPTWWRLPRPVANVVALGGFAAIVWSAFAFDATTPFPGSAALVPVLGTAAIIAAGTRNERLWHSAVTATKPVQWVGNVSYSLYLWHWPLIVIAPFALRAELSPITRVAVLVLALVLAALTKRFVEDSGQRWRRWADSTRRAFVYMAIGMAVVIALAGALAVGGALRASADRPPDEVDAASCVGPRALEEGAGCADPFGPAEDVVMTTRNEYFYSPPECGDPVDVLPAVEAESTHVCDFSDGRPARDVWLVGDSHAQQWQGAVFDLARENGWRVTTSYFGGCPVAEVAFRGFRVPWNDTDIQTCVSWARGVSEAIIADEPDVVFTSMAARLHLVDDGSSRPFMDQYVDGLRAQWVRWTEIGTTVAVLGDPPFNQEVRSPDCVAVNQGDPLVCARPRAEAQPPDPLVIAADPAAVPGVVRIDLSDRFCDDASCYAVVGGVPVYYDADHLNLEYVRMLAPIIASALDAAGVPVRS